MLFLVFIVGVSKKNQTNQKKQTLRSSQILSDPLRSSQILSDQLGLSQILSDPIIKTKVLLNTLYFSTKNQRKTKGNPIFRIKNQSFAKYTMIFYAKSYKN